MNKFDRDCVDEAYAALRDLQIEVQFVTVKGAHQIIIISHVKLSRINSMKFFLLLRIIAYL